MSESIFEKNIEIWAKSDPKTALMLPYHSFVKPKKSKESLASLEKWVAKLNLKETDVLFVYGLASGNVYLACKDWLKKKGKRLIFLEDDLNAIYDLFLTDLGHEILLNDQVSLEYFRNLEEANEKNLMLRWEFYKKNLQVVATKEYLKLKFDVFEELSHRIYNDQSLHNSLVNEYLDFGSAFFRNFYQNIDLLPGSCLGTSLFGKFKNVPAIICGAGPSLNKHLSLLKSLQNKALIFAGGSSLNALTSNGVTPHFGAGIDPNSTQLLRIRETCHVKVPFFFRNRIYHEALKSVQGPRLYIPGSGGYDISELFENELKIHRDQILDEGHNVINFEVEVAHAMGCHPIIFVGMDLAYTDMKAYADGIVKDSRVTKNKILQEPKINDPSAFDLKAILRKDIFGKPIYTLWKWIVESEWMGDFAKEHPKIHLINATEGGLGFPGIENLTLSEVQKKYLKKNFDLEFRIKDEIEKSKLVKVTKSKVNKVKLKLKESLKRAIQDLDILLQEIETMSQKIKGLKKIEQGFNIVSGRAALFESDLFDEEAYKYVLDVFSDAFAGLLSHEMRNLKNSKLSEKKKALKKLEINARRLAFLRIVAEVNLALLDPEYLKLLETQIK